MDSPVKLASATVLIAAITLLGCAGAPPTSSPAPSAPAPAATATATPIATAVSTEPTAALEAKLDGPRGLAFNSHGNLYVSECQWTFAAIDKIDSGGVVTRFAGTGKPGFAGDDGPAISAQLYCPTGIAVGPDGAVYFADHVNNRIRRVDAAGTITTFAGSGPAGLNLGTFSGDGGPATQATLQEPWGVAFDDAGSLFIADRDNARVRRVDMNGDITTVAGIGWRGKAGEAVPAGQTKICPPVGVAIDSVGSIIIPDACATTVRMVDGDGIITTIADMDSGDASPDFGSEGNATLDANGSMLIQAGPRVLRMDSAGVITTVAGNGSVGAPTDGSSAADSPLPEEIAGLATIRLGTFTRQTVPRACGGSMHGPSSRASPECSEDFAGLEHDRLHDRVQLGQVGGRC